MTATFHVTDGLARALGRRTREVSDGSRASAATALWGA